MDKATAWRRFFAAILLGALLGAALGIAAATTSGASPSCVNCLSRRPPEPPRPDVHVPTGIFIYRRGLYGELLLCELYKNARTGVVIDMRCEPVFADWRLGIGHAS